MKVTLRAALSAVAILVLTMAIPTGARAATTTHQFWVIEHNLAGGTHFRGANAALTYFDEELDGLVASIGRGPDMIALEEVCYSQYRYLQSEHPTWDYTWTEMADHQGSCGDQDGDGSIDPQGQVVASRWNYVSGTRSWTNLGGTYTDTDPTTGQPRRLQYLLGCMDVSVDVVSGSTTDYRSVHVCVAHLRPGGTSTTTIRAAQIDKISTTLESVVTATHHAVIVAGDFNTTPRNSEVDSMYDFAGGTGQFREGDQTDGTACPTGPCRGGEMTLPKYGNKVDFVFYSDNRATGSLSGDARYLGSSSTCHDLSNYDNPTCSDHRLYRAYANLVFPGV